MNPIANARDGSHQYVVATPELGVSVLEWTTPSPKGTVLLLHGARGSALVWWKVARELAQAGFRVVCPDLPGHGNTPLATELATFGRTAGLVRDVIDALKLDYDALNVAGTSWGSIVASFLASRIAEGGKHLRRAIAVEPPVVTAETMAALQEQFVEEPGPTLEDTQTRVDKWYPAWSPEDRVVKAESLFAADPNMLAALVASNGTWDGSDVLRALRRASNAGTVVWIIRGTPADGGLTPDSFIDDALISWPQDRILTIDGAGHVPHRTHPIELAQILLRSLS